MTEMESKTNRLLGLDINGQRKEKFDAFKEAYEAVELITTESDKTLNHDLSSQHVSNQSIVGMTDLIFDLNSRYTRKIQFLKDSIDSIVDTSLNGDLTKIKAELDELMSKKKEAVRLFQDTHRSLDKLVVEVFELMQKSNESKIPNDVQEIYAHSDNANNLMLFQDALSTTYGDDYVSKMSKEEENEYAYLYGQAYNLNEEQVQEALDSKKNLEVTSRHIKN